MSDEADTVNEAVKSANDQKRSLPQLLRSRIFTNITMGQFGIRLKEVLQIMPFGLGGVARATSLLVNQSFSKEAKPTLDLLPLPIAFLSAEDMRDLTNNDERNHSRNSPFWSNSTLDGMPPRQWRLRCLHSWVFCCVIQINYMYIGFGDDQYSKAVSQSPPSAAQLESLRRLHLQIDEFLGPDTALVPERDWRKLIDTKRMAYDGEVVAKAQELTMAQVLPGLPPEGVAGSVNAIDLATPRLRALLEDPSLSVKPRSEWPRKLRKARMRIARDEWHQLGAELVRREVVLPMLAEDLVYHNGDYLLNGIFGVGKGTYLEGHQDDPRYEILRLIINLVPSNELQTMIQGDIETLPHFSQWACLELMSSENFAWTSEDVKCAFYVFTLPAAWRKYFALAWPLPGKLLGLDNDKEYYLGLNVIPMGWLSAVGICQHLLRQKLLCPSPAGAGLPRQSEMRKDRTPSTQSDRRVNEFFQQYIDNYDAGSPYPVGEDWEETTARGWQHRVRQSWKDGGVPRSEGKTVEGSSGTTLGVTVDGIRGGVSVSADKVLDLASLTMFVLSQDVPRIKDLGMLTGRWVFSFQLRRPLMVCLDDVWMVLNGQIPPLDRHRAVRDEFLGSLCLLPMVFMDWRRETSALVTCSDASEEGGGVCYSTGITTAGYGKLGITSRTLQGGRLSELCLFESFSGISAGRRALEVLGATPGLHVHCEVDEACCRVVKSQYPDAVNGGDVTELNEFTLRAATQQCIGITHVIHLSGPPCQDVSGLNATGSGITGSRSSLVHYIPEVKRIIQRVFPGCAYGQAVEMVASLTRQSQETYDEIGGGQPLRICPGSFGWVRRPRLFWPSWNCHKTAGVEITEEERWTTVRLSGRRMPLRRWLKQGWLTGTQNPLFPTFVRAMPRKQPPFKPAGIQSCDGATLARWEAAKFIYPPYQFKPEYLVKSRKGRWQPPDADMREIIMGFPRGYTMGCWSTKDKRADLHGYEFARCSMIGNTFNVPVMAWLLAQQLYKWKMIARLPTVSELADPWCSCDLFSRKEQAMEMDPDEAALALVRHYFSKQSLRGGDVRSMSELNIAKVILPGSMDPEEWTWKTAISTRWQLSGEHINVLECRAYLLALRWRLRNSDQVGRRFLHMVDSQVTLFACVKGRSSSHQLRRVLCKINAYVLAGHCLPALGYVRTDWNPADEPSRFTKKNGVKKKFTKKSGKDCPSMPSTYSAAPRQRRGR